MKTFPQTEAWVRTVHFPPFTQNLRRPRSQGGQVTYPSSTFNQIHSAIVDFSTYSQDPKAAIILSYNSYKGEQFGTQLFFYDGPTPPPGTFDNFINIPTTSSDLKTRSYLDVVLSYAVNSTAGLR